MSLVNNKRRVSLVLGVANQRSIAWACAQSLYQQGWDVIVTYQHEKSSIKVQSMIDSFSSTATSNNNGTIKRLQYNFSYDGNDSNKALFFTQQLPELLQDRQLNAIVHSIAHAPNLKTSLLDTKPQDYIQAHLISAYSLIDISNSCITHNLLEHSRNSSITAISYLGAIRAIPGYNIMGPAKASLESIVRGLALELGCSAAHNNNDNNNSKNDNNLDNNDNKGGIRVNAVSAGPIPTISAKGGIHNFEKMRQQMEQQAPLGNITAQQVASTVSFLATEGTGITGQTIYVDGGYSIL